MRAVLHSREDRRGHMIDGALLLLMLRRTLFVLLLLLLVGILVLLLLVLVVVIPERGWMMLRVMRRLRLRMYRL